MSAQSFPTPTSTLYKLACDFERAANAGDHVAMGALLADDYTSQFYPASLRTPGFEARANKTDTLNRAKQMLGEGGLIKQLNIDVDHPVNVVEAKDCIVLQLSSNGVLASGKAYPQEYLHIIRFNADQKIISSDSWNDSALAHSVMPGAAFPKFGEGGTVSNHAEAMEAMEAMKVQ